MKCRGVTRSDFKYFNNKFYLLEINTQPGMTSLSLVPEIAQYRGLSFENLVEKILLDANVNKWINNYLLVYYYLFYYPLCLKEKFKIKQFELKEIYIENNIILDDKDLKRLLYPIYNKNLIFLVLR